MWQAFLELLAEIGLLHADYKHRKSVAKKEAFDGKPRPFERHYLSPSNLALFFGIGLVIVSVVIFGYYNTSIERPHKMNAQMIEIEEVLYSWKMVKGHFPQSLEALTRGRPLREQWLTDAWDRPYHYRILEDGNTFELISPGADGKLATKDDVKASMD